VVSDRATNPTFPDRGTMSGAGDDAESIWTDEGSGRWEGAVTFNDGNTQNVSDDQLENTKFGDGATNTTDNLFHEAGTADAVMHFFP